MRVSVVTSRKQLAANAVRAGAGLFVAAAIAAAPS